MRKVILFGWPDYDNIGDQFLGACNRYLVSGIAPGEWDYELINITPPKKGFRFLIFGGLKTLARMMPQNEYAYKLILMANRVRSLKYYRAKVLNADAIIISLGSFKYSTQDLWTYYSLITEVAEAFGIPVMFNAMNVQDYDEMDFRCRMLCKSLQHTMVKVFTTRDGQAGINELRMLYGVPSTVTVCAVGDSGFWIPECYGIHRVNGNTIGVNLIRDTIFLDYDRSVTPDKFFDFYSQLILQLIHKGYKVELFTNGMRGDLEFGKKLLRKMEREDIVIRVPKSDKELVQLIAGYKGIIGARLHACICAYALDVPMAGFIWDKKMLRFSQVAKLEKNFVQESELNAQKLIANLEYSMQSSYDVELRNSLRNAIVASLQEFLMKKV